MVLTKCPYKCFLIDNLVIIHLPLNIALYKSFNVAIRRFRPFISSLLGCGRGTETLYLTWVIFIFLVDFVVFFKLGIALLQYLISYISESFYLWFFISLLWLVVLIYSTSLRTLIKLWMRWNLSISLRYVEITLLLHVFVFLYFTV